MIGMLERVAGQFRFRPGLNVKATGNTVVVSSTRGVASVEIIDPDSPEVRATLFFREKGATGQELLYSVSGDGRVLVGARSLACALSPPRSFQ